MVFLFGIRHCICTAFNSIHQASCYYRPPPHFQLSITSCFAADVVHNCYRSYLSSIDRVFIPIARALTTKPSGISPLQRVGIGLVLNLISIVFAVIIEPKRLALAREYGLVDMPDAMIPMSVW
ncbi:protein NRT1/ PTR FAMILY 5.16 [Sesamum alatum]|uniref:Protein NRT1/ PTR FAMILY 5.16 n=1 Tax=Sesamum alatum TaxID=300844 RepID=A0AAE1XK24_9LAMI|nr:protein NRT1/ PTR FAMILY 5.16 [Sesamum alatum]